MWTWDLAPDARKEFASLPDAAQEALVALMEGIVGPDPQGIRQAASSDPGGVMLRVPFGASGLVTILVHVRGSHVMVLMIQWAG